jgi:hypothetical protein
MTDYIQIVASMIIYCVVTSVLSYIGRSFAPPYPGLLRIFMRQHKCTICLNLINTNTPMQTCSNEHVFHRFCLQQWVHGKRKKERICPTCHVRIK